MTLVSQINKNYGVFALNRHPLVCPVFPAGIRQRKLLTFNPSPVPAFTAPNDQTLRSNVTARCVWFWGRIRDKKGRGREGIGIGFNHVAYRVFIDMCNISAELRGFYF